ETPVEAFGEAKGYAEAHLEMNPHIAPRQTRIASLIGIGLTSFLGSAIYASGIIAIGKGGDAWLGLNPWVAFLAGAAVLILGLILLPADLVRHPETDAPLMGDMKKVKAITLLVLAAVGIVLYTLGRVLA